MNIRKLALTLLAATTVQSVATAQIIFLEDASEQDTAAPFGHGGQNCVAGGEHAYIGGGRDNTTYDAYCVIGGGDGNTAGTDNGADEALYATVLGGHSNSATNAWSTVGAGFSNVASGSIATVLGGRENTASGDYSVVMGGYNNVASGSYAVASGRSCTASGDYSLVIGLDGTDSGHDHSFVWAGASGARTSAGEDTFNVWAANGIYLNGSVAHSSDRNLKENFRTVNSVDVLEKVAALPLTTWKFKAESDDIRHIGPMSQDFHEAFGYNGHDDRHIAATDADGVSMVAIQGLYQKLMAQQIETQGANARLSAIEARLQALENH